MASPFSLAVPGWLNETFSVEGFFADAGAHDASTLNDMIAHDDNIKMSLMKLTIRKKSGPFAQGATSVAAHARTAASITRFVLKSSKRGEKGPAHLAEEMRCQALCKVFALEFNALSGEEHPIDFIVPMCLKSKSGGTSGSECLSLEPFIEGTYVKYNNCLGYVNKDNPNDRFNQAAHAFSHFTFERSRGDLMVAGLQGIGQVLIDPVILTRDPDRFKLSDHNVGEGGFDLFFSTHVCNGICRKLGLQSNAAMMEPGKGRVFRQAWPSMDGIVCCANKLCGKILRLASARRCDTCPAFRWCDVCWPQLYPTVVVRMCVAPGPAHEFNASRFFYESQGRSMPRKCAVHREEDTTACRTVVAGADVGAEMLRNAPEHQFETEGSAASSSSVRRKPLVSNGRGGFVRCEDEGSVSDLAMVDCKDWASTPGKNSQLHVEDMTGMLVRFGLFPRSLYARLKSETRRKSMSKTNR